MKLFDGFMLEVKNGVKTVSVQLTNSDCAKNLA